MKLPFCLLTLSSIFLTTTAFAQKPQYFDNDWKPSSKKNATYYRIVETLAEDSFYIEDYYITGEIQFRGHTIAPSEPLLADGTTTYYFKDGRVQGTEEWIKGKRHGNTRVYYPSGDLFRTVGYRNGNKFGFTAEYFPGGGVYQQGNIDEHGNMRVHERFYPSGDKEFAISYENNEMHGPYTAWYEGNLPQFAGQTIHGVNDGLCRSWHKNGQLYQQFTVNKGLLDGEFTEWNEAGDTMTTALFNMGAALFFRKQFPYQRNNSTYKIDMKQSDGIEHWQLFRDGRRILTYQYRNGMPYGTWKLYDITGNAAYQSMEFGEGDAACSDEYLQGPDSLFSPTAELSERFSDPDSWYTAESCALSQSEPDPDEETHPISGFKYDGYDTIAVYNQLSNGTLSEDVIEVIIEDREQYEDGSEGMSLTLQTESRDSFTYVDPAQRPEFYARNTCDTLTGEWYEGIEHCRREQGGMILHLYTSLWGSELHGYSLEREVLPNEVVLFYKRFENKTYPKGTRSRDRLMIWSIGSDVLFAMERGILDSYWLVGQYEHGFFDAPSFSGFAAFDALDDFMETAPSFQTD